MKGLRLVKWLRLMKACKNKENYDICVKLIKKKLSLKCGSIKLKFSIEENKYGSIKLKFSIEKNKYGSIKFSIDRNNLKHGLIKFLT